MAAAGTASPFADDSWHKNPSGLDAIAEFNASYDQNTTTIDPQLTFGNPRTPNLAQSNLYMPPSGLDQTLSPDPIPTFSDYPHDFSNQGMGSPYFHQTIETQTPAQYAPSPLGNIHNLRTRSISEPPGQPQHQRQRAHQQQQQQSEGGGGGGGGGVVFTRQNQLIGTPLPPPRPMPSKSGTRSNRQPRQHPYARPTKQQQQPHHQQVQTFHPQRSQTMAPTSMPYPQPQQQQQQVYIPSQPNMMLNSAMPMIPEPSPYSVSRVCTPAPETPSPSLRRQVRIDPNLTGGTMRSDIVLAQGSAIVTRITVEELRELIFETVRKALDGVGKGKAKEKIVGEAADVEMESVVVSTEEEVVEV